MKSISNTLIAVLIAFVLTAFVALIPLIPICGALEDRNGDQMMDLCHSLHQKYSPLPPDSHLIFAAIDEPSVQDLGRWPFSRSIHGQFLQVLAPEKPKVVAWDILFTESTATAPDFNASSPSTPPASTPLSTPPVPPPTSATPATSGASQAGAPSSPATSSSDTPPATAPAPVPPAEAGNPPPPESDDQVFADGAALFPRMVTGAKTEDTAPSFKNEDLVPTRCFKNVKGDITQLFSSKSALFPFPILRKHSFFGFADEDIGKGGVRRTMPLVVNIDGNIFPSLDLQIVMQYWDVDPDKVSVDLGHEITMPRPDGTLAHIPIDNHGFLTINYRARLEDFSDKHQAMSYSALATGLANKEGLIDKPSPQQNLWKNDLPTIKDNIVVVGVTIAGTDAGVTPIDTTSPLVDTHLNVINNILQNDYVRPLSAWIWLPLYAVFLFVVGNLMLRVGVVPMIPIGLLAVVLLGLAVFGALWFANLQVPVAFPEIGILLLAGVVPTKRFFGEEREKRRVRSAMKAYLSEKVMNKVLEHPDNVKLGGAKQEITVMFCDIRGFTKYCDDRDPQEVLNVVNDYFEEMTQVVFRYDGTVDKYIGDCIMAFWNAPQPQADHAQQAVCCAMEMRYALANFKTKRAGKDTELFECGIGIHTGEALVGNMGSSLKLNYTAMGSTVNMAARLEALTKRLNERVLISQATLDQLQGDFPLTDRGEAMVPGFANPVHVYAVGADQDISAALKVGRVIAGQQEYTAEEVTAPIWEPAPLPKDADPE